MKEFKTAVAKSLRQGRGVAIVDGKEEVFDMQDHIDTIWESNERYEDKNPNRKIPQLTGLSHKGDQMESELDKAKIKSRKRDEVKPIPRRGVEQRD